MSTFRARDWADVGDPALIAGERRVLMSRARSVANARLQEMYREVYHAIWREEWLRVDSAFVGDLRARRAALRGRL